MASHHTYAQVECPCCGDSRLTRKDLLTKARKEGKMLLCKSCAMTNRPVTWRKEPGELVKNQGAYKSYMKAKQRVATNHNGAYSHVEFRFTSYQQFLEELGPRPDGMTLDRINNNGHYEPGNVRWASIRTQARNRGSNVLYNFNGRKMCVAEICEIAGIHRDTVRRRMQRGCPKELLFVRGRVDTIIKSRTKNQE